MLSRIPPGKRAKVGPGKVLPLEEALPGAGILSEILRAPVDAGRKRANFSVPLEAELL